MPMGSQDFWYNPTWGPENGSILISLVPTSASPGYKCCKSKTNSPACMPSMQGRQGRARGGGKKATVAECETLGSVCPGPPPARAQRRDPWTSRPFRLGRHPVSLRYHHSPGMTPHWARAEATPRPRRGEATFGATAGATDEVRLRPGATLEPKIIYRQPHLRQGLGDAVLRPLVPPLAPLGAPGKN